jgi:sec-independent protein translocase protein TatB
MNLGMSEMLFIFLLALIIFGPKKLPQVGREIGKVLNEFKRASNEFKNQLETEIDQIDFKERETTGEKRAADVEAGQNRILPPSEPTVASSYGEPPSAPAAAPATPPAAEATSTRLQESGSVSSPEAPVRGPNA